MISYEWRKNFLIEYFKKQNDVKSVTIATAYFSKYGLNLLQDLVKLNGLSKEKVTLYLSEEFSNLKAAEILKSLNNIATVYIVEKIPLHAKVYLLEKEENHDLIHGSANFTQGGLERNLEFFTLQQGKEVNIEKLKYFFDYCKNNAVLCDTSIIEFYKELEEDLQELKKLQQQIHKKVRTRTTLNDPFQKDEYDLESFFFTYEDYEILFRRNEQLKINDLKQRREQLRAKLLYIDRTLRKYMNKLDLYPHWNPQNVTSGIEPNIFNRHRVSWMGIRYGKTEHEVKLLNTNLPRAWGRHRNSKGKNEQLGFQKHSCIQFCLVPNGFEVILFHAVASEAIDRGYLHDLIDENKKRELKRIINAIDNLKGKGFTWYISDPDQRKLVAKFEIDEENPPDFLSFYKKYDKEGYTSVCQFSIKPDNVILKDKKEIAKLVLRKTKELLPLYKAVTFREQYALKTLTKKD